MGEQYTPEISDMRDQLASEIKDKRKKRDTARKDSTGVLRKLTGSAGQRAKEADQFDLEAKQTLREGREAIDLAIAKWQVDFESTGNTKTDQHLLQWFYHRFRKGAEAYPVATDSFIDKSREEYNAAWLTRELVQNFVDHNPDHPGTLDGVTVKEEDIGDGKIRFTITGDWKFEDPTGVISLHSDKPEGMNTGGGNGIGLKQTAIRLMRDFDVDKFEIQGEHWNANYQLAKKDKINEDLEQAFAKADKPQNRKLKHDWLVAKLKETPSKGNNSYVIETDSPELIRALQQFDELGVSERNGYLQDLDFKNEFGAIKWLFPKDRLEKDPERGRLFINGQVMNYGAKGKTSDDYWVGPQYITLQLNNVEYKMSVDRPPVDRWELGNYIDRLVNSLSAEQIIEQLKASEPIWTQVDNDEFGSGVVIEKLVNKLLWKPDYKKEDYSKYFSGKNYLAKDYSLTTSQNQELQKRGFILCPYYFVLIGMPGAATELSDFEVAKIGRPNSFDSQRAMEQAAEESGIQVAYEDLSATGSSDLFELIKNRLAGFNPELVVNPDNQNKVKIKLDGAISAQLLSNLLVNPTTDEQKLLYFIRGLAFKGINDKLFKEVYLSQGDYLTTFASEYDSATRQKTLFIRKNKASNSEGLFIELELDEKQLEQFRQAFQRQEALVTTEKSAAQELRSSTPTASPEPAKPDSQPLGPVKTSTSTELTKPKPYTETRPVKVVDVELTAEARAIAKKLEARMPYLIDAVNQLNHVMPPENDGPKADYKMELYRALKDSGDIEKVAVRNSNYLGGTSLLEILAKYNDVNIKPIVVRREVTKAEFGLRVISNEIARIANRFRPPNELVDNDFEIVLNPEQRQLAQLGLLRMYIELTTDAQFNNDVVVFKGSGAKAINLGTEAIGIHEELLKEDFTKAMVSFAHELAHNEISGHGLEFVSMIQALSAQAQDKLLKIINKQALGIPLDPAEESLRAIYNEWNNLR